MPWSLIDEAGGLEAGRRRTETLDAAINGLDDLERKILEGRAVVRAMQALDDPALIPEAERACDAALARNVEPSFIAAHLAEALFKGQRFEETLVVTARVDRDLFERRDLRWRNVRIDQIRGACLLRLGCLEDGVVASEGVWSAMGAEEFDEFLPAPTELVAVLVEMASSTDETRRTVALALLARLESAVELAHWFSEETVAVLRSTRARW